MTFRYLQLRRGSSLAPLPGAIALLMLAACSGGSDTATTSTSSSPTSAVPTGPVLKLMALGDSITAGNGGGYRVKLQRDLTAGGRRFTMVGSQEDGSDDPAIQNGHEGHPGFWIENLAEQVDVWIRPRQPDVVLLMAGTNDILNDSPSNAVPNRLSELIDKVAAAAPNATILVSAVPSLLGKDQARLAYNAAIPGVVSPKQAAGKKVAFVDVAAGVQLTDLRDGVHPNEAGDEKLGAAWAKALDKVYDDEASGRP